MYMIYDTLRYKVESYQFNMVYLTFINDFIFNDLKFATTLINY